MKLHDAYVDDLLKKLIDINNRHYNNQKDKDGDIGERFVKDCIKYYMWEKDFRLGESGNRIFSIKGQYKVEKSGYGGIDFRFRFVHNNRRYDCYVESKNWKKYKKIHYSTFTDEILDRFTKNTTQQRCKWIVTMNKSNIPLIEQWCQNCGIYILPIDKKITTRQLNTKSFTPIMKDFLDELDKLMKKLTGKKLCKSWKMNKKYPRSLDADIIKGLPPKLISLKHGVSEKYVWKRKSELKNQGNRILDGRSKIAVAARFLTKEDLKEIEEYIE